MGLEVIYVIRHGFRTTFHVDSNTGIYSATVTSPTNIPTDPPLSGHGVEQSKELRNHLLSIKPPVDRVYSSPYYRCLQTIEPYVNRVGKEIRGENGIGEWFGAAFFNHPSPAPSSRLHELFPTYSETYTPAIIPTPAGETVEELYDRTAYALSNIIAELDNEADEPKTVLLCTHAATLIAAGRVLTGILPENVEEEDFKPFTCSLSKFVRRKAERIDFPKLPKSVKAVEGIPIVDWRDGRGVGGGWDCTLNGDCSFLSGGAERGWRFSGDESFIQPSGEVFSTDAGDGLGVVIEGEGKKRGEQSSISRL